MDLRKCYEELGGNYDEVLSRLQSTRIIQKFVLKFLNDGSFQQLKDALHAGDGETAFRAAHTLKGVCANLGFTKLYTSSNQVNELLRAGNSEEAQVLMPQVEEDYRQTVRAIEAMAAEEGEPR